MRAVMLLISYAKVKKGLIQYFPSILKGMLEKYGFISLWTCRDHCNRLTCNLFNTAKKVLGFDRELAPFADTEGCTLPARKVLINWFATCNRFCAARQYIQPLAVKIVANTQTNGLKTIQYVQFSNAKTRQAIDLNGTL